MSGCLLFLKVTRWPVLSKAIILGNIFVDSHVCCLLLNINLFGDPDLIVGTGTKEIVQRGSNQYVVGIL